MSRSLQIQARRVTRPLLLLCGVTVVSVVVMSSWERGAAAVAYGLILGPSVAYLGWQAYRGVMALLHHAHHHAASAQEAERHYFEVLRGVVRVVEDRDPHTAGRSERISRLTAMMAEHLGLPEARAKLLALVAEVHDIGLLSVPPRILRKPTGLNGGEYGVVQDHCDVGCRMLEPLTFLGPVLPAVRHHHERMNGTGYPEGLTGENIPLEARILAVADSFDAMTHDRPHRAALTTPQAVSELIRCADVGYDRQCVIALAHAVHMEASLPVDWSTVGAQAATSLAQPAVA